MSAGVRMAPAALAVLLFIISCAKVQVIDQNSETDITGTDPLNFTCKSEAGTESSGMQQTPASKAAQPLTSGFMVSTYKHFGTAQQHPVMERYDVEYKTSGTAWDGNVRPYWDYTGVEGQYEKYWDFSALPYRFNAVSPYPADPSNVTLTDHQLILNTAYKMQTVNNGLVSPGDDAAEPYLVAQVQRNADGRDFDYMATSMADNPSSPKEINAASLTLNRYVALPFHHLNSKVRFGIYCTAPWATANPLYIQDLTVKVVSLNFVTSAGGYSANGNSSTDYSWYLGTGNSGFTGLTVADPSTQPQLLRFDGGKEVADNDLSLHQGRSSAYWLQCPDGIMQIPQNDVQLQVSLKIMNMDGTLKKEFNDVPIRMEDGTDRYNWISGYINTYYLIIGDIDDELEIEFTSTLAPWEDISGSLSTDLEK